ncbi:MAG: helicase-related protein, partial [Oleibacter sp.]|nr:helicase-related protein [Thalassolituus sp.]
QKTNLLIHLIKERNWHQVLVFSRTKHGANKITKQLEAAKIKACAIHGNKSQGARTKALADFKDNSVQVMVATDIAARGLDIDQLPQVVNYDLPNISEDYVHRIGRTGRAGADGQAVSLVSADEFDCLAGIERLIKKLVDRETVAGFEPSNPLPESRLDMRPIKPKKPKKPSSFNDAPRRQNNGAPAQGRNSDNRMGNREGGAPAARRSRRRSPKPVVS